jgi:hypothetical protein
VCLGVEAVLWPNGLQLNVAVYKPHVSQPDPVSNRRAPCLHTRTHEVVTKCRWRREGGLVVGWLVVEQCGPDLLALSLGGIAPSAHVHTLLCAGRAHGCPTTL